MPLDDVHWNGCMNAFFICRDYHLSWARIYKPWLSYTLSSSSACRSAAGVDGTGAPHRTWPMVDTLWIKFLCNSNVFGGNEVFFVFASLLNGTFLLHLHNLGDAVFGVRRFSSWIHIDRMTCLGYHNWEEQCSRRTLHLGWLTTFTLGAQWQTDSGSLETGLGVKVTVEWVPLLAPAPVTSPVCALGIKIGRALWSDLVCLIEGSKLFSYITSTSISCASNVIRLTWQCR